MKNVLPRLVVPLALAVAACGTAEADSRIEGESTIANQDPAASGDEPVTASDFVTIHAGGVAVQVEIADEPAEHSRGLMHRQSLGENEGMLFIYPSERTLAFWMKNTLVPLDIAYADREGRIVDIQQMEPQTTENHPSAAPAQYALEMNQGWFEANGVRVGDRIEF